MGQTSGLISEVQVIAPNFILIVKNVCCVSTESAHKKKIPILGMNSLHSNHTITSSPKFFLNVILQTKFFSFESSSIDFWTVGNSYRLSHFNETILRSASDIETSFYVPHWDACGNIPSSCEKCAGGGKYGKAKQNWFLLSNTFIVPRWDVTINLVVFYFDLVQFYIIT